MRGETMKNKLQKNRYSTTFGVDPEKVHEKSDFERNRFFKWWPDQESNQGHKDFQSSALPTELSGQILKYPLHVISDSVSTFFSNFFLSKGKFCFSRQCGGGKIK